MLSGIQNLHQTVHVNRLWRARQNRDCLTKLYSTVLCNWLMNCKNSAIGYIYISNYWYMSTPTSIGRAKSVKHHQQSDISAQVHVRIKRIFRLNIHSFVKTLHTSVEPIFFICMIMSILNELQLWICAHILFLYQCIPTMNQSK